MVAIDPCAAYARAVRTVLPHATIVVDHFHLQRLANDMVTKVRRRVAWENWDRRGGKRDPEWANRRRLLTARERLTPQRMTRMWDQCTTGDPSGQLLAAGAYIAKEQLRDVRRVLPVRRLVRPVRDVPEIRALADTIDTWWPEIEAFLRRNITNARTEGSNLAIKTIKRTGRGFTISDYQRRILANATAQKAA